jgi:hypothetical protein
VPNRNPTGAYRPDNDAAPGNRKLIRPNLSELADRYPTRNFQQRKQVPPEQTNAESYYYLKQMAAKTPMVVVLTDGPNLLIQKASIKYLFKQAEEEGQRGGGGGNR